MADNTTLNPGAAGDVVRDIDHSGIKTQVVGLDLNPAGAESLMSGSMPVTPKTSGTGTTSSVSSSATNVTLLAANANRLGAAIFNESTQVLYMKCGATASATDYTCQIPPNSYYEVPFHYTGKIDGIWASANGAARVTEFT